MKKYCITMIVIGGGLATFGLSGFSASLGTLWGELNGGASWDNGSRIEITVGVVLFLLGISIRKELRVS